MPRIASDREKGRIYGALQRILHQIVRKATRQMKERRNLYESDAIIIIIFSFWNFNAFSAEPSLPISFSLSRFLTFFSLYATSDLYAISDTFVLLHFFLFALLISFLSHMLSFAHFLSFSLSFSPIVAPYITCIYIWGHRGSGRLATSIFSYKLSQCVFLFLTTKDI